MDIELRWPFGGYEMFEVPDTLSLDYLAEVVSGIYKQLFQGEKTTMDTCGGETIERRGPSFNLGFADVYPGHIDFMTGAAKEAEEEFKRRMKLAGEAERTEGAPLYDDIPSMTTEKDIAGCSLEY